MLNTVRTLWTEGRRGEEGERRREKRGARSEGEGKGGREGGREGRRKGEINRNIYVQHSLPQFFHYDFPGMR